MRTGRIAISAALALVALAAVSPAARADDSQIKISEVYSDASAAGDADFIEFQLTTAGQTMVTGHHLYTFTAAGALLGDAPFPPARRAQPTPIPSARSW